MVRQKSSPRPFWQGATVQRRSSARCASWGGWRSPYPRADIGWATGSITHVCFGHVCESAISKGPTHIASHALQLTASSVAWSKPSFHSGARITPGYCWPTCFNVLGVLFLGKVFPAFLPSKKVCWTHKFWHLGVGQQYPVVLVTLGVGQRGHAGAPILGLI